MLRLEHATGFVIPADLEGVQLDNLQKFTDNPDGLLLIPPDLEGIDPRFELHSLREGLLAFNALVRYRNNSWAKKAGHRMLETVHRCLKPDGTWDRDKFKYHQYACLGVSDDEGEFAGDYTGSTGRFIEALVWFYEATGDSLAIDLADRLGRYHLEHTTNPDGTMRKEIIDKGNTGHTHSYLGTLRGLLLLGLLTQQREYVDTVAATYRVGVASCVVTESGWAAHDLGKVRFPDESGNRVPESASATMRS